MNTINKYENYNAVVEVVRCVVSAQKKGKKY